MTTKKRALRWLGALAALPLVLGAVFLLAAWIGSSIPRNGDWTEPDDGIRILIETNGVHTGIVMPVISSEKDWRETFPSAGQPRERDGWMPTHISIGWGEKEVFLTTPTMGRSKGVDCVAHPPPGWRRAHTGGALRQSG